jgi:hypothetical protein
MPNLNNLHYLLQSTKKIVDHHHKLSVAKGEHFNIFSVLDIEKRENKTHSAFLAELLNPKGSHYQEEKFLRLFLQIIGKELPREGDVESLIAKFINTRTTFVTTEFSIGKRDDKKKEGGRLDILISNGTHCICIENKIDAIDQKDQIERYQNYNSESNNVFYLTLKGGDPHQNSKGELEAGEHFFNISYREHILEWLELCLKEVPNLTSVREAINQYIQLIKKLTHQLNMEQKKDLESLMTTYLEEARFITDNFEKMVSEYKEKFRKDIEIRLKEELEGRYKIQNEKNIAAKFSKISITKKEWSGSNLLFGLEPFSGAGNGDGYIFIGLLDRKNRQELAGIPDEKKINNWWKQTRPILTKAGNKIKLQDLFSLRKITARESAGYKELVDLVVNQSLTFIQDYEEKISAFILKEKNLKLKMAE